MLQRLILTVLITALVLTGSLPLFSEEKPEKPNIGMIELSKIKNPDLQKRFAAYYEPVNVSVTPKIEPYALPLKADQISNWAQVSGRLGLKNAQGLLFKNGFVVKPYGSCEKITAPYDDLKKREVPIFVTSDTLLHLYHIQFGETLRRIEETVFYDDLVQLSAALKAESERRFEATHDEAWRRCWGPSTVPSDGDGRFRMRRCWRRSFFPVSPGFSKKWLPTAASSTTVSSSVV